MGGKDEHSSPPSAGTGADPSLRLSGFIIGMQCFALPEERAGVEGLAGPVLSLQGRERLQSFSRFAFLSATSSVLMVRAG